MLPFLKKKDDGVGVGPVEVKERDHDEGFDFVAAIAEDLMMAIEKKDKALMKDALLAFCEYLKEEDSEQDESLMKGQSNG